MELGVAPEVGDEAGCTVSDLIRDATLSSEPISLTQTQGFARPKVSLLDTDQRNWPALTKRELSGYWKVLRPCFPSGQKYWNDIFKPTMHL